MQGYDPSTYGERWADIYDDWYDDPAEVRSAVRFLAGLAGEPDRADVVLELGIGTGRIALPLAALGLDVRGIDASPAMVERLRSKDGGAAIPVTIGDMADVMIPGAPPPSGACSGVFVAANTFFNLTSEESQRRCLAGVRAALRPGGWFVLAAFVPAEPSTRGRRDTVSVRSLGVDHVVLTADVVDPDEQQISGQFIVISEAGIRLRPFHVRYLLPAQLDEMAATVGLALVERWSTWDRDPFGADSTAHVSLYRRPAG